MERYQRKPRAQRAPLPEALIDPDMPLCLRRDLWTDEDYQRNRERVEELIEQDRRRRTDETLAQPRGK